MRVVIAIGTSLWRKVGTLFMIPFRKFAAVRCKRSLAVTAQLTVASLFEVRDRL